MPEQLQHRKLINIRTAEDGLNAKVTMQKHSAVKLFKSWVDKDNMPNPCYSSHEYEHLIVDKNYVNAQRAIKEEQGKDNLYYAGIWTQNGDSHENAIISGMDVAEQIGANPELLAILRGEKVKTKSCSESPAPIHATL